MTGIARGLAMIGLLLAAFASAAQALPPSMTVTRMPGFPQTVAVSPDERMVAIAGGTGVTVWDLKSGTQRQAAEASETISAVAFSSGDRLVAVTEGGGAVEVDLTNLRAIPLFQTDRGVAAAVSSDATFIAVATIDGDLNLWSRAGSEAFTHQGSIPTGVPATALAISPDGRFVAVGGADGFVRVCNRSAAAIEDRFRAGARVISSVAIASGGRRAIAASWDGSAYLWRGSKVEVLAAEDGRVSAVAMTAGGERVAVGAESSLAIWNIGGSPERLRTLRTEHSDHSFITAVAFAANGQTLVATPASGAPFVASAPSWAKTATIPLGGATTSADLSPSGRWLATASAALSGGHNVQTSLWDVALGAPIGRIDGRDPFFISDELVGTVSVDNAVHVWQVPTGRFVRTLRGFRGVAMTHAAASADGKNVLLASVNELTVWRLADGERLFATQLEPARESSIPPRFGASSNEVVLTLRRAQVTWNVITGESVEHKAQGDQILVMSPSGALMAALSGSPENRHIINVMDLRAQKGLWQGDSGTPIAQVLFNAGDVERLLMVTTTGDLGLLDSSNGKLLHSAPSAGRNPEVRFSRDGRLLIATASGVSRFLRADTLQELGRVAILADGSWFVADPFGRYDATDPTHVPAAGWWLNGETVPFHRMRRRYYEPALLPAMLDPKLPLRAVPPLASLAPPPLPNVDLTAPGQARITVKPRSGGVGTIRVSVNGREIRRVASEGEGPIAVSLEGAPIVPGGRNVIEVVASNGGETLDSAPATASWDDPSPSDDRPPEAWIVTVGTSRFGAPGLNLDYAASDARSLGQALAMAAEGLFGADRVHIRQLGGSPTRTEVEDALRWLASSHPADVVLVYLAGHGVAFERDDGDPQYWYVTSEAKVLEPESALHGLTGNDMYELVRHVPALKQAWFVDTCAAAAAESPFRKAAPSSRAIAEMADRTGFYVMFASSVFGSTFQSSLLRRSILTHSLLLGLSGPALREGQFVDVGRLWLYSNEEVPRVAARLCPPSLFARAPLTMQLAGGTFDAGKLTAASRRRIGFEPARPFLVAPLFLEAATQTDTERLADDVTLILRTRTADADTPSLFLDGTIDDEVFRPSGTYVVEPDLITVMLTMKLGDHIIQTRVLQIPRKGGVPAPAAVVEAIDAMVREVCGT